MVHGNRVSVQPSCHLSLWTIFPRVGPGVPSLPIGDRLDQRWPVATPRPVNCLRGAEVHVVRVIAVDHNRVETVRAGPIRRRMRDRRHEVDWRVLHIEVVLTHENHRELPHHCHVQRLVEGPDVGGPVAEEGDRDLIGASHLCRPGSPVGDAQMSTDDRVGAHHPSGGIRQVH